MREESGGQLQLPAVDQAALLSLALQEGQSIADQEVRIAHHVAPQGGRPREIFVRSEF